MSLVNQVLKDLQHRRTEHPDMSGLAAAQAVSRPTGSRRWLLLAVGAVALGLGLFVLQAVLDRPDAPAVAGPRPAPQPTVAAEPPATEAQAIETAATVATDTVTDAPAPEVVASAHAAVEPVVEPVADPPVQAVAAEPARTEPTMTRTLVATTPRQRADAAYADGQRELAAGRRDLAEVRFRDAVSHDPSFIDARLALANMLATSGAAREAEGLLLQGLRLAPDAAPLAQRYARLLFERDDLGGAIGVLLQSPPPVAVDTEYHAFLAALLQRAGNHAAAADTYESLVKIRPDAGLWWMGLGISLEAEQRYAPALDAYRNAARDPRLTTRVADFVHERIAVLSE